MSVDTITFSVYKGYENVSGKLLERYAAATFSTGYPTGGYTFPKALRTRYGQLGIADLVGVDQLATNTAGVTYTATWDGEAQKLVVLVSGVQVANNVDIHTIVLGLKFIGTR
jgi:hypothetical protein